MVHTPFNIVYFYKQWMKCLALFMVYWWHYKSLFLLNFHYTTGLHLLWSEKLSYGSEMWLTLWVKTPKSCSELVQTQQLLSSTINSPLRALACQLTWEKVWKQSPEQQYFSNFCCWGWWVYKVPIISCETFTHWTHSLITERLWNKTKLRPFLCFHINYI